MGPVSRGCAVVVLSAFAAPVRAVDPDELLKYAPARANAVVVINVDALLATPRATKEGWAKADHTEYLAGAVPVHPRLERIVVAKEVHPQAPAQGAVFAVAAAKKPLNLDYLAKATGGQATTLAGEPAVGTPNGSVLIPLDKQLLGVAWSDSRQDVARWVRSARGVTASPLSRFLISSVHNLAKPHHITIALDTEDLFDARQAGLAVAQTQALAGDEATAAAVEKFAAGLKGVVLTVDVTADGLTAAARFDSSASGAVPAPAFKAFVIEALARNGAMLEDLQAATAKATPGSVTLSFKLSDPELARITSLFLPPVPNLGAADVIAVTPAGVSPAATRKYILAVNRIVDDLKLQNKKAKDYEKTSVWHAAAANKIEALSVLNVDKMAVEYGLGTAARLQAIADSLHGVPVQAAILESKAYVIGYMPRTSVLTGRGVRFNPWLAAGPQSVQTNLPQIREQQAEVIKKDQENRGKLWDQIERQRSEIRRAMAEAYKIDTEGKSK
jgi:hypothetical protein